MCAGSEYRPAASVHDAEEHIAAGRIANNGSNPGRALLASRVALLRSWIYFGLAACNENQRRQRDRAEHRREPARAPERADGPRRRRPGERGGQESKSAVGSARGVDMLPANEAMHAIYQHCADNEVPPPPSSWADYRTADVVGDRQLYELAAEETYGHVLIGRICQVLSAELNSGGIFTNQNR